MRPSVSRVLLDLGAVEDNPLWVAVWTLLASVQQGISVLLGVLIPWGIHALQGHTVA